MHRRAVHTFAVRDQQTNCSDIQDFVVAPANAFDALFARTTHVQRPSFSRDERHRCQIKDGFQKLASP